MELIWFPVVALVALAGIRVIGTRLGFLRAFLVAWAGLATAGILLTAVAGESHSAPRVGLVVVLGLLAMIAWTGVVELFSSARSQPTATGPTNPWRAVRHKVARGWRKAEIAMVATRFGLSRYGRHHAPEPRGSSTGRALRGALERAGGVYVKLGQFLSTRPDLVSPDIAAELARLQQSVDPIAEPVIRAVVAQELPEAFASFRSFSAEPAAAASIAQVHHAELEGGQRVAVKVQRPDVAERVRRDLDILVRLAEKLDRRTQWAYELRVVDTVRSFADAVASELDFEAEARNLRLMASAVSHHRRFVVPQPIPGMTRRRVLVMDWVDGAPLAQAATSLPDRDRAQLAGELLHCFLDQVLTIGTFHADPHPGNIVLTPSGQIALLDCGSIGMLDRRQRGALRSVLVAIANQDPGQLRDALRDVTRTSKSIDEQMLERALGSMLTHHFHPGATPGAELVTSLMQTMREYGLALEPVVGGAFRTLATLQSTLELLAPGFDLLGEARSYAHTLVNPLRPGGGSRSPREELETVLPTMLPTLMALPRRLEHIIEAVERNELSIGVHLFPSEADRRFANHLAAQLSVAVVATAIGVIGGLLILAANPRLDTDTGRVLQAVGVGCVGLALLALLSTLVAALRRRRERP